jgi:hypothetical protein
MGWRRSMIVGVVLIGGGVAAMLLVRRRAPQSEVLDINVDRGLSDCPWPPEVRDPNGPAGGGPTAVDGNSYLTRENVYLVLRDNDRVFLAERVREVQCIRPSPGPDIMIELDPNLGPLGDDQPPAVNPNVINTSRDASADVTAYRRVRKLLHDTRVTDPWAFQVLENWYASNHREGIGEGRLTEMGKAAVALYYVQMFLGEPTIRVDVKFFRDLAEGHVCVPGGAGSDASGLPACPDGGFM